DARAVAGPAPVERHEDRRPFVGREHELEVLHRALDDATAARGRIVLIGGEPGIGKSRLAEVLGAGAAERGAQGVWGRWWEGGGGAPGWPWGRALRACAGETRPAGPGTSH